MKQSFVELRVILFHFSLKIAYLGLDRFFVALELLGDLLHDRRFHA